MTTTTESQSQLEDQATLLAQLLSTIQREHLALAHKVDELEVNTDALHAEMALERRVGELEADLHVLRSRVAMLDGGSADVPGSAEDDFWRQLYKKSYQQDDYDAFVTVRGPLLSKLDIIERAGMMEEFHKVALEVCS